eukprot:gene33574-41429_t
MHLSLYNLHLDSETLTQIVTALGRNSSLQLIRFDEHCVLTAELSALLNDAAENRMYPITVRIGTSELLFEPSSSRHGTGDIFECEDSLEARHEIDGWQPATVLGIHSDFKYAIRFDNGQILSSVR